jgi:hypothetical protein
MVMPKNRLKQHFTNDVALHNWTMKLGFLKGAILCHIKSRV